MRAPLASSPLARHDCFAFEMKKPGKRANAGRARKFSGDPMMNPSHAGVKVGVRTQHTNTPQNRLPFQYRPDPVALDQLGLDFTARAVFVLLLDNSKSRGWRSRLSNSTIGRILNRNPMTISRALGRLESRGLIRRDLIAGGRIRLSITVVWEGVRREDLTEQAAVRRDGLTGSTRTSEGLGAAVELIRGGIQSEGNQTAPISPSTEEDAEQAALFEQLGPAKFLRMMMEKGRQEAEASQPRSVAPSPAPPASIGTPPAASHDDVRRAVEGMARDLGRNLAAGRLDVRPRGRAEHAGRRRSTPQQLQEQLAELRRRTAARKAASARSNDSPRS